MVEVLIAESDRVLRIGNILLEALTTARIDPAILLRSDQVGEATVREFSARFVIGRVSFSAREEETTPVYSRIYGVKGIEKVLLRSGDTRILLSSGELFDRAVELAGTRPAEGTMLFMNLMMAKMNAACALIGAVIAEDLAQSLELAESRVEGGKLDDAAAQIVESDHDARLEGVKRVLGSLESLRDKFARYILVVLARAGMSPARGWNKFKEDPNAYDRIVNSNDQNIIGINTILSRQDHMFNAGPTSLGIRRFGREDQIEQVRGDKDALSALEVVFNQLMDFMGLGNARVTMNRLGMTTYDEETGRIGYDRVGVDEILSVQVILDEARKQREQERASRQLSDAGRASVRRGVRSDAIEDTLSAARRAERERREELGTTRLSPLDRPDVINIAAGVEAGVAAGAEEMRRAGFGTATGVAVSASNSAAVADLLNLGIEEIGRQLADPRSLETLRVKTLSPSRIKRGLGREDGSAVVSQMQSAYSGWCVFPRNPVQTVTAPVAVTLNAEGVPEIANAERYGRVLDRVLFLSKLSAGIDDPEKAVRTMVSLRNRALRGTSGSTPQDVVQGMEAARRGQMSLISAGVAQYYAALQAAMETADYKRMPPAAKRAFRQPFADRGLAPFFDSAASGTPSSNPAELLVGTDFEPIRSNDIGAIRSTGQDVQSAPETAEQAEAEAKFGRGSREHNRATVSAAASYAEQEAEAASEMMRARAEAETTPAAPPPRPPPIRGSGRIPFLAFSPTGDKVDESSATTLSALVEALKRKAAQANRQKAAGR